MATPVLQVPSQTRSEYRYEFVESHTLQSLDLSRSLGSVCCGSDAWRSQNGGRNAVTPISHPVVQGGNQKLSTSRRIINAGLAIGLLMIIVIHVVPAPCGRPIAVVATVIAFPAMVVALRIVRYDVLVLLLKSYDFWYLFVVNSVTCGLIAAYLNDLRAVLCIQLWLGIFNGSIIDSRTLEIRKAVAANVFGAIASFVVLFLIQWGVVPAARHFAIFHYRDHVLGVEDVITNGLGTITVMMGRNAIRRIQDLREQRVIQCTKLRCVSYRCTIKFRRIEEEPGERVVPTRSGHFPHFLTKKPVLNEMTYVDTGVICDASATFYPIELDGEPWPRWQRLLMSATGVGGIALTILGFAAFGHWSASRTRWPFAAGLAFTSCFYLFLWGMSHTKVLREILHSFDFFFLSAQLTTAHLCACDMFEWDSRCLGLLSSWLWMHFVLTADALTPAVRKKLALQTWHLAVPVLLFVTGLILFACEIVFARHWDLQDRKIHSVAVGSRTIEYRIISFFFSRLVTILLWCFRLLWRILQAQPDDLVLLRGKVAYAYLNNPAVAIGPSEVSERDPQPTAVAPCIPKTYPRVKTPIKVSQPRK
ncbi:hypothetical protein Gpo141_00007099 [Globisporangium polare]